MKTELYKKIFDRMDALGAIRLADIQYASMTHTPYKDSPVLSDCMEAFEDINDFPFFWDCKKPYLKDQSDELGEKLLSLIP